MKSFGFALLAALTVPQFAPIAFATPIFPGLSNKLPLTEAQVGQLLMGELRCRACHSRKDSPRALERSAPNLSEVGARVAPEYLRQFIASPSAAHSGSTMPDLMAAEPADQRTKIAERSSRPGTPHTIRKLRQVSS